MSENRALSSTPAPPRPYCGARVPTRLIRRYARQIAEHFQPDKIILFGSHAYGRPHLDSDVDLLVIMPARNQHSQAVKIRWKLPAPFPMDLIVRTPQNLKWRLEEGESFHTEILTRGKVLYEKSDSGVGEEGRGRLPRRRQARARSRAVA
ncbi:MAG: nucleotidyltransferase domain-containing protein [Planctomycetia bacterium]|nr:nucleotidyltransferase domain-containing protein [Planctomycetia bacterium]